MNKEDKNKYDKLVEELGEWYHPPGRPDLLQKIEPTQEEEGHQFSVREMDLEKQLDEKKEHWRNDYDQLIENDWKVLSPMDRETFAETAMTGGLVFLEKDQKGTYVKFRGEDERNE